MKYTTEALVSALVLLKSKLKHTDRNDLVIIGISTDNAPNKSKARYINGDIYFTVIGGNRITTFTVIDDNLEA